MEPAVIAEGITKHFEKPRGLGRLRRVIPTTAVQDVSLTVPAGELFGLLGPNGAGKTTLIKIFCTLILPSAGRARIAGHSLAEDAAIRAAVGFVVADERSFYWRLTARQNLQFFAALHRMYGRQADERVIDVLRLVDLVDRADDRFSNYSSGMRQRLAIARSLLHQPDILFLDEPSRSLDPTATNRLHNLIRDLMRKRAVTIFLITHDLSEAEKLCDRVAVMHQGRLRAIGRPVELRQKLARQMHYQVRVDRLPAETGRELARIVSPLRIESTTELDELHFPAGEIDGSLTAVLDLLRGRGLQIHSIEGSPPTLEEVFSHFTR
jgi:ABC-2 type transport system ATP-binding protein